MVKTRKQQMRSSCDHDVTYYGLHKWYNTLFEKAGWMILAKSHGYNEKLHNYKSSVQYLRDQLVKKHKRMHDKDKKEDLYIMLKNTQILMDHINRDF